MKTFDYKPNNKDFTGSIQVEIPNYQERIELIKSLNFSVDGLEVDSQDAISKASQIEKMVLKHIKKINLQHKPTKVKIVSADDLGYSKEGCDLINELGQAILNGVSLGNV